MLTFLRPALVVLALMTLLTGLAYPFAVTGVAALVFPEQARASLIERDGVVVGSRLVGQGFASAGYFHPRPSAVDYNAASSGASNLGPTNAELISTIGERAAAFAAETGATLVPIDAVTGSGSGLDPHVSPAAAIAQIGRVAEARGADPEALRALVEAEVEGPWLGLFGSARVNVLELNLALDGAAPMPAPVAEQ